MEIIKGWQVLRKKEVCSWYYEWVIFLDERNYDVKPIRNITTAPSSSFRDTT
jgi:hypothetical protein